MALEVEKDKEVKLTLLSGEDLPVKVWDQEVTLKEGQSQCLKD
ncbi:maltose phosphorylase [Lactobacillus delbrueckii subsp. delbrueckii DSM 20074 = JCM 1012]|nr:maltose phosphorylase [Lactobacillus delbrueckii subsp. delbrueckii DSM 20074 = JCM 1012]